jgi:hypothetical protein
MYHEVADSDVTTMLSAVNIYRCLIVIILNNLAAEIRVLSKVCANESVETDR